MNPRTPDGLLSPSDAAEYLGIQKQTLNRWRSERRGPTFVKLNRGVRYKRSDLEAYVERNTVKVAG